MRRPILLVRPDRNDSDAAALEQAGLPALIDPYLRVEPVSGPAARALADELANSTDAWLVVTSPRTMAAWRDAVGAELLDRAIAVARGHGLRIAAVGEATAATIAHIPDLTAREAGAAGLAAALAGQPPAVAFLPQGRRARRELAEALTALGWTVRAATVYDTIEVDVRPASAGGLRNLSGVLLRSPSAVAAFARWQPRPAGLPLFAVGPTTARSARDRGWPVHELPVAPAAAIARVIARDVTGLTGDTPPAAAMVPDLPGGRAGAGGGLPDDHPMVTGRTSGSAVIQAYRGRPPARRPIWMMRQAGRSLPEYRAIRQGTSMLDACLDPELAAEITVQPVRRHGVDAGIFFSDIVVPLKLAGLGVDIVSGVGPVLAEPIRTRADIRRLGELEPASLAPIRHAVALAAAELGSTPLIGFAGAPFTVASYLVEGRPTRDFVHTRALMADQEAWHALLGWVARTTGAFLRAQAEAGASALQVFDSWVGALSVEEYRTFAQPHSGAVLAEVAGLGLPRVHFGTRSRSHLIAMRDAGADVMGIDAATPLDEANALLGGRTPLQGNIDPLLLTGPWAVLAAHTADVIRRGRVAPGHVINLGHGVPKDVHPDVLTRLVDYVHTLPDEDLR